jgi:hypothetical protein
MGNINRSDVERAVQIRREVKAVREGMGSSPFVERVVSVK